MLIVGTTHTVVTCTTPTLKGLSNAEVKVMVNTEQLKSNVEVNYTCVTVVLCNPLCYNG